MPKIVCPHCGASAWGRRLSDTEMRITYGRESKFCQAVGGSLKAGEPSVPTSECQTFHTAMQEAIASGRLSVAPLAPVHYPGIYPSAALRPGRVPGVPGMAGRETGGEVPEGTPSADK